MRANQQRTTTGIAPRGRRRCVAQNDPRLLAGLDGNHIPFPICQEATNLLTIGALWQAINDPRAGWNKANIFRSVARRVDAIASFTNAFRSKLGTVLAVFSNQATKALKSTGTCKGLIAVCGTSTFEPHDWKLLRLCTLSNPLSNDDVASTTLEFKSCCLFGGNSQLHRGKVFRILWLHHAIHFSRLNIIVL